MQSKSLGASYFLHLSAVQTHKSEFWKFEGGLILKTSLVEINALLKYLSVCGKFFLNHRNQTLVKNLSHRNEPQVYFVVVFLSFSFFK